MKVGMRTHTHTHTLTCSVAWKRIQIIPKQMLVLLSQCTLQACSNHDYN